MKNFILFFVILFVSTSLQSSENFTKIFQSKRTTHRIVIESLDGGPHKKGSCSATSIGPHALLTAEHCVTATDMIQVDGEDAYVDGVFSDGLDHAIFLLHGIRFENYADVGKTAIDQGQHFYMFGNPGDMVNIYREGYVSGYSGDVSSNPFTELTKLFFGKPQRQAYVHPKVLVYECNGYFGDSGAALFDAQGKIVGVVSFINIQSEDEYSVKFMGGYEMRFSDFMLTAARGH